MKIFPSVMSYGLAMASGCLVTIAARVVSEPLPRPESTAVAFAGLIIFAALAICLAVLVRALFDD